MYFREPVLNTLFVDYDYCDVIILYGVFARDTADRDSAREQKKGLSGFPKDIWLDAMT